MKLVVKILCLVGFRAFSAKCRRIALTEFGCDKGDNEYHKNT